nr:ORF1 [Rhodnius prolixus virus 5]
MDFYAQFIVFVTLMMEKAYDWLSGNIFTWTNYEIYDLEMVNLRVLPVMPLRHVLILVQLMVCWLYLLIVFWFIKFFFLCVVETLLFFQILFVATVNSFIRVLRNFRRTIGRTTSRFQNRFEFESMRPGSQLLETTEMPTFQGEIQIYIADLGWIKSGQCFVAEGYLYTAAHVLRHADKIRVLRAGLCIDFNPQDFTITECDVAYMPAHQVSKLGFSYAKFGELGRVNMVSVTNGQYTTIGGVSSHDDLLFVEYTGSTTRGFSGAPYFMGKTVWGMHTGAANVNMGLAPLTLQTAVKTKVYTPEATAEFLMKLFRRKNFKPNFKVSPFDPSELFVDIGHKSVLMDRAEFFRIYGDATEAGDSSYEPESCDYQDSKNFVLEQSPIPAAPVATPGISLPSLQTTGIPAKVLDTPKRRLTKRTRSGKLTTSLDTAPPALTTAQSEDLLQPIVKNTGVGKSKVKYMRRTLYLLQRLNNMGVLKTTQAQECQAAFLSLCLDSTKPSAKLIRPAPQDVPT